MTEIGRQMADAPAHQFDQHPRTAEAMRAPVPHAPVFAVACSRAGDWGVTLICEARIVGRLTPGQARLLGFDLLQMAGVCEGRHAAQVAE